MQTDADAGLLHRVVPRPYYERGGITIYHGDCREILPAIGRVDFLFTSQTYN